MYVWIGGNRSKKRLGLERGTANASGDPRPTGNLAGGHGAIPAFGHGRGEVVPPRCASSRNRIARLDVHLEKTGFVTSKFEDALPELKKQARQAGADAVIEIQETRSQILETMVYHVTATGVRYVRTP